MSESESVSTTVQAIVTQAQALGLSWNLRLATVANSSVQNLNIIFDGDTAAISAINITGMTLVSGARVYVLMIPTTGNYIIGYGENTSIVGVAATVTAQALPGSATTAVSWTGTTYNKPKMLITTSTTITIPSDGMYSVTANALLAGSGTRNFIEASDNGGLFLRSYFATPETFCSTSGVKFLSQADTVVVNVFQNGGATTMDCMLWLYRIG